jgi:G:T/U-mismatch repair DNA glycosylase
MNPSRYFWTLSQQAGLDSATVTQIDYRHRFQAASVLANR